MAMFGNVFSSPARSSGGMSAINMALLGVLAYRTLKGRGRLADMLGNNASGAQSAGVGGIGGLLGSLGGAGGLSGIFGGQSAGNVITDGLHHLMERFQQNGQGDKVQSWVSANPNSPIAPHELQQALGEERIQWLIEQTGLPRDELLAGLSQKLPEAVDLLTPHGRLPEPGEAEELLRAPSPA